MIAREFKAFVDFAVRDTLYRAGKVYHVTDDEVARRVQALVEAKQAKWIGGLTFGRVNGRGIIGG
jgi:hypothetical protein